MKNRFSSVIIVSRKSGYVPNTDIFLHLGPHIRGPGDLLVSSSYPSYAYTRLGQTCIGQNEI